VIKSRRVRWLENLACKGEITNTYKILIRKPHDKESLWIPEHKWDDSIKISFRKIGGKSKEFLAQVSKFL
jgi:hypothetical protein